MNVSMLRSSNNLVDPSAQNPCGPDDGFGSSGLLSGVRALGLCTELSIERRRVVACRYITRRAMRRGAQAALLAIGLICSAPSFAGASALPSKPQTQSDTSKSVQPQVDKRTDDAAAEKRKALLADAGAAVAETENALKALDDKKKDVALKALADATGKLELIVARDPKLALAPIHMDIVSHDLFAGPETVKAVIQEAKNDLAAGEIQNARPLLAALASDIEFRTTNIPLATYPAAIKAITPLIDAGKIDEAKAQLQAALNTLVVTTDVVPLPRIRAESLLKEAQTLAEKKDRTRDENEKLDNDLKSVREQLQLSQLLGYGKTSDYKPMEEQLDEIEKKTAGGQSGTGWFDKIKKQLSDQFKPLSGS